MLRRMITKCKIIITMSFVDKTSVVDGDDDDNRSSNISKRGHGSEKKQRQQRCLIKIHYLDSKQATISYYKSSNEERQRKNIAFLFLCNCNGGCRWKHFMAETSFYMSSDQGERRMLLSAIAVNADVWLLFVFLLRQDVSTKMFFNDGSNAAELLVED